MAKKLRTFVLVYNDETISPPLVTIKDYARWLMDNFDEVVCHQHLYLSSKKKDGQLAFEWHPGTKLGNFFDNQIFKSPKYHSWYLPSEDKLMQQLIKHDFADMKECRNYHHGKAMLRVYTLDQIEIYIKTAIDKDFSLQNDWIAPKQMVLSSKDRKMLAKPTAIKKKTLF